MPGPNPSNPCPCGSRRRYKTCCMGEADAPGTPDETVSRLPDRLGPRSGGSGHSLPADLRERVADVDTLLDEAGFPPPWPEREAEMRSAQGDFESACRARWREVAGDEPALASARRELEEAGEAEGSGTSRGYKQLRDDLTGPLDALARAGEAGVPHLGVAAHDPGLVGLVALETVTDMEQGPRRNRLLVEALFTPGTEHSDAALRAARELDPGAVWSAFEAVVRWAGEEGHELQGTIWTGPFQDEPPSLDEPIGPAARFGDALQLLRGEGHAAAFADGLFHVLDPSLDGPDSVQAFLEDEGVQAALEAVRAEGRSRVQGGDLG